MSEEEKQILLYMHSKNELGLATLCVEKDKEIERLNNVMNNLEEYSETEIKYWEKEYTNSDYYDKANILGYITALKNILNKMKELKGVDKNDETF